MPEEDLVELKFRIYDGSDIGPFRYSPASTVAMVKERIVADWPKDKKIVPKGANDLKLINAGKVLENNKTVGQCRVPFGELPRGVITMHAVVQPSLAKAKTVQVVLVSAESFLFVYKQKRRLTRPQEKVFVHVPYCN
ncbi:Membrane-anchored ubiquitin-fold protein 4 [Morella rubra]|uniref:Membrane-anchored ubiquitin-fold protein 4 n=1 Tax=Morella rubra TaxID=262757 RepID=A0A6A1VLB1_9ROSI|nr:Membrane-anchored ubiquitin-fold protein 4 [Morella rubra]